MRRISWLAAFLLLALLSASPAEAQTGRNRNRIPREEIEQAHAVTVYDLVRARRPAWLNRQHATGLNRNLTELLVFVDGARLDNIAELHQISAANVDLVEFLSSGQSEFRFGQAAPNGTIAITTRGASRNRAGEAPSQSR
jgi:hypothetical protein